VGAVQLRQIVFVTGMAISMGFGANVRAHADVDLTRWLPAGTRVLLQVDPVRAAGQPRTREALGIDAVMATFASPRLEAGKLQRVTVAYVPDSGASQPVAFSQATASLAGDFAHLHGDALETAAGRRMFKPAAGGAAGSGAGAATGALTLIEPECIAEGPRRALHAVLEQASTLSRALAGDGHASVRNLLIPSATDPAAVSLVYVAPGDGSDLFSVLQDLDRILGLDMSAGLEQYQKPMQLLGTLNGARLDLRQDGDDLATTLWLAMPNRMAAQIASVSLDAGKDMARVAAQSAVKAGNMTKKDALVLGSALDTMRTSSEGDVVRVSLRVARDAGTVGSH
jgi:hypothetical protein